MSVSLLGRSWREIAQSMRDRRDLAIATISPGIKEVPDKLPLNVTDLPSVLLSEEEIIITESVPEKLLSSLSSGTLTSETVTSAFIRRSGVAQKLTNCITELMPERALQRAKYLDEYLSRNGRPIGPLHGLPISVKEHVGMKDLNHNAGFISWCDRTASKDAFILTLLWNSGAVFYTRTTQPQTLMHLATSNNIYGVTVNPFNRNLTPGGSSGGEGALIGIRGSCLGVGSDIGGSIRSPAANNGIFGLKPTTLRLPMSGVMATKRGAEQIVPTLGPLSTSLAGLDLFMRAIIDQKPWLEDPSLVPLPWRDTQRSSMLETSPGSGKRVLRIGVLRDDGVVKPHPTILRAIDTVVSSLQLAAVPNVDVVLVDFPPFKHADAWRIASTLYFADGGADETAAIDASGEPWRPLSEFILKENPNVRELSVHEIWDLTAERDEYRHAYGRHWNSVRSKSGEPVDVLLCPAGPGAAPPLDAARYWGYTSQWNLLDYPAAIFPTGLCCQAEVDEKVQDYEPRNRDDEYNYNLYDARIYCDAPLSLQLVGRRYEDEKVLEAVRIILQAIDLPVVSVTGS